MDRLEKSGLLVVPETAREENTPLPTTGIVVGVGFGMQTNARGEPIVREGDMIMFSKYAGSDVYFNEEAFRIMETREILCTLELREGEESVAAIVPVNDERS